MRTLRLQLRRLLSLSLLLPCLLLLAPAAGTLCLSTGCKHSPQTLAYKSLASVGASVDAAMLAYFDLVKQGKLSNDAQVQVMNLHMKYQPVFHTAVLAAKMDLNSVAPAELVTLATSLIDTINTLRGK